MAFGLLFAYTLSLVVRFLYEAMEEEVFTFKDGFLFCEGVRIKDLLASLRERDIFPPSPCFVYSQSKLLSNIRNYKVALRTLSVSSVISFAMKANFVPDLLHIIRTQGCSVTLVSGMELKMALSIGFQPHLMVFNGNGKQDWERIMAIKAGCLINVDSSFDLKQTLEVCQRLNRKANVLLRVNPDIDPEVHPYISTGLSASKFGISTGNMETCINLLHTCCTYLDLVGLHCHLGSTIHNTDVFRDNTTVDMDVDDMVECQRDNSIDIKLQQTEEALRIREECRQLKQRNADLNNQLYLEKFDVDRFSADNSFIRLCTVKLLAIRDMLKDRGFTDIKYINIGGGLDIDYMKLAWRTCPTRFEELDKKDRESNTELQQHIGNVSHRKESPTAADLVAAFGSVLKDSDVTLIVEPGRSIIGNTAILATTVLGTKYNGNKRFIVTDGAMTEVLRPSLYGAYHHIELTEPCKAVAHTDEISRKIEPEGPPISEESQWKGDTKLVTCETYTSTTICEQDNGMELEKKYVYDIVGPVCESTDFLGKDRLLPKPHSGCGLAVFDVGAYCSSMSSNYNMRLRPCEVLVNGNSWHLVRRPDTFEDLMRPFKERDDVC